MKIIQITTQFFPYVGGVENFVNNLSRQLIKQGHEVIVYTTNRILKPEKKQLSSHTRLGKITIKRFRSFQLVPNISPAIIFPHMLKCLMNERDADIIHAHNYGYFPAYSSSLAKLINKIPLVLSTHTTSNVSVGIIWRKLYNETLGKFSLKMANHIICSTVKEKKYLITIGADPTKLTIVPNGVDYQKFSIKPENISFKKEFNIHGKIILFVGRLSKEKGLHIFLKVAQNVLHDSNDIPINFVFVGPDGGEKAKLISLAKTLGINEHVFFVGPLYGVNLVSAYSDSDIFVLPSLFESFGISLLEAMAAGKPFIATRNSAAPMLLQNGAFGYIIDPINSVETAMVIKNLLVQTDLQEQMGRVNQSIAMKFTWNKIVNKILKVYEKMKE